MSRHPETSEIFFVRHAPVVKKSGHVPPADPPIQDLDYRLERVAAMLPQGADWHVSPLLLAHVHIPLQVGTVISKRAGIVRKLARGSDAPTGVSLRAGARVEFSSGGSVESL